MAVAAEVGKVVRKQGNRPTGHWQIGQIFKRRRDSCVLPLFVSGQPASGKLASWPVSLIALGTIFTATVARADTYSFILSGLGGEPVYEQRFREEAATLAAAALELGGDESKVITLAGDKADRNSIRRELGALAAKVHPDDQVIVTLIGHGSFDGDEYRFNLPGPDLTATELAALFDHLPAKQQLIVNASSASGSTVERWKRDNRIVITATKSGGERTATRFAQYWVKALASAEADVNKDDIVTASEAFEFASRKVAESFKTDVSLATEHARLEGSDAASFQVARFGTAARVTSNPQLNELFAQRVRIERDLDAVKERKASLPEPAYYDELEGVLVRLALLQKDIDAKQKANE